MPWSFAPAHMNKQRAGAVAALGMKYFAAGRYESAAEHRPEYLRLSQAERERKEQQHTSEPENAKENPLTGTSETVNEGSRL